MLRTGVSRSSPLKPQKQGLSEAQHQQRHMMMRQPEVSWPAQLGPPCLADSPPAPAPRWIMRETDCCPGRGMPLILLHLHFGSGGSADIKYALHLQNDPLSA